MGDDDIFWWMMGWEGTGRGVFVVLDGYVGMGANDQKMICVRNDWEDLD